MGLRIQNNIAAMNAHRQLSIADAGLNKSLERLSSGYRINRAADDAAGLAISQQFRADIASFKVASRNTAEASSLLQVAEGAMDQIGNMLTRLKELATQAASANAGSNLGKIEAEKIKLVDEIERIAQSTKYAGSSLLNGEFGAVAGAVAGGASTTTNSYGVSTDYSQKFVFTDATQSLMNTIALGVVASNTTLTYMQTGTRNGLYTIDNTGAAALSTITMTVATDTKMVEGVTYAISIVSGATITISGGGFTESEALNNLQTVTFADMGIVLSGATGLTSVTLNSTEIKFVNTGIGTASMDGSGTSTSAIISGLNTLTVSANTAGLLTFLGNDAATYTATVSGSTAYSTALGLTINLDTADGGYGTLANDAVGLEFALSGLKLTDSPTAMTITSTKTDITAGTYNLNWAGGSVTTVTISNAAGTYTDTAAISGTTLTFANLGITLAGTGITGAMLGNDNIVVSDTGIASLSVGSSTATGTFTIADSSASITVTHSGGSTQTESASAGNIVNFDQLGIKISLDSAYAANALANLAINVTSTGASTFQVGANNTEDDRISISIGDTTTAATGLNITNATLDLNSSSGAQAALTTINTAINTLAEIRGDIGAAQNRLGYAAANLATTIENVQAAESIIRDVDMAAEMTMFTKNQILMQASTSMLAQANMAPQSILSLFGG